MHADVDYVTAAFRAGAAGYVLKRAAASELMTAIREVLQGRHYVTPLVTKETLNSLMTASSSGGTMDGHLTPRQREVLRLVCEGRTHKEIAVLLHIATKTVEFHKTAIMRELRLRNSADLIRYALTHGLIAS
jgi:DNA-binding NarL/FixJ family response regulator